jgi:hypothetical protein
MVFLAASPIISDEERKALVEFLELWAASSLAGGSGRCRQSVLSLPQDSPYAPVANASSGNLVTRGGSRWFVQLSTQYSGPTRQYSTLEVASAPGRFELLPGATVVSSSVADDGPWSPERVRAFLKELASRGPSLQVTEAIDELSRRTGLARPEAALLWGGFPSVDTWSHDFLGKQRRDALGLKTTEANVAKAAVQKVAHFVRRELLAAAASGAVDALWKPLGAGPEDESSPVARMAAGWNKRMGQRVAIDSDLVVRCARELPRGVEPSGFLAELARCSDAPAWNRDGDWELGESGVKRTGPSDVTGEVFSEQTLVATARYLPFLFDATPVGDPLRAQLPRALVLSRQRMAHPGLLAAATRQNFYDKPQEKEAFLDAIGKAPYPPGGDRSVGRDGGLVVARQDRWGVAVAFRPARVTAQDAPATRLAEGAAAFGAARLLQSEGYSHLVKRVTETAVTPGGYEANPLASVPALVAEVRTAKKISEEAAALYLQILAHHAPTARAVQRWNGWTAARYKKAAGELSDQKLVVEAKRARAGRDHFLPGSWEELKAPEIPIESWKLPLYRATRGPNGISRPLGVLLPLQPIHQIFEAAWARLKAGDLPGYEEIK